MKKMPPPCVEADWNGYIRILGKCKARQALVNHYGLHTEESIWAGSRENPLIRKKCPDEEWTNTILSNLKLSWYRF